MRLTRVHVEAPLSPGVELNLPENAAAHLSRVLRLSVGDDCVLFNGDGHDYLARIVAQDKRGLRVAVSTSQPVDNESPLRIVLLQGVARGEKMDLILQKATELGIAAIAPLWSQRSEVKLDAARAEKRLAHWRGVVGSACEQCGRARVPEVAAPVSLGAALDALPAGGLRLILDPEGELALASLSMQAADVTVVLAVGPEGGWSPTDREQLRAAGFQGMKLGPRILRTETAGLAAIAALQSRLGDLG
jgi:16S rRNA (uracil1498-N3)-methyltransferase